MSKKPDTKSDKSIKKIKFNKLIPYKKTIYNLFDLDKIEKIIKISGKVKEILIVTPTRKRQYYIISGYSHWKAVSNLLKKSIKIKKKLPCIIKQYKSKEEKILDIIIENYKPRKLTLGEELEQYLLLRDVLTEKYKKKNVNGRVRDHVAQKLQTSGSNLAKLDRIANNLIFEYRNEIKNGQIKKTIAYELSRLTTYNQKKIWNCKGINVTANTIKNIKHNKKIL